MGISAALITVLIEKCGIDHYYATTKNDGMRILLTKLGFTKAGNSYLIKKEKHLICTSLINSGQ